MNTDQLKTLSLEALIELKQEVEKEIFQKQKQQKQNLIEEFKIKAAKLGLSFEDLMAQQAGGRKTKGKKVEPKYRHPTDPSLTWTGRGRTPKWVETLRAQGKTLDDLAI